MPRSLPILAESKRPEVVTAARSFVGARWGHQKRSRRAVDCIGLIAMALRDAGVDAPDERNYEREPDGIRLRAGIVDRFGEPVLKWRHGDIVLMRWATSKGVESHVGILFLHADRWHVVHAHAKEGRVVEHSLAGEWMRRVSEVFSLTGAV